MTLMILNIERERELEAASSYSIALQCYEYRLEPLQRR